MPCVPDGKAALEEIIDRSAEAIMMIREFIELAANGYTPRITGNTNGKMC